MDKKKLVICAIFKNEARYLPEWLAYHHVVGVEHFVLYDNGSTDDPAQAIRNSPLAEQVTLIHWPQRPGQLAAYRHFIDIFAPSFEWAAFLDLDEFLLPLHSRSVLDTLDWLRHASAILVHWRVFGPGPWEASPPGLVIENYDQCAADDFPTNRHIKTIARCSELLDVTANPHEFNVAGRVFNTAGHPAPNVAIQEQPCYQNLVINHYFTRSRQDWLEKIQRGSAMFDYTTPKYEAGLIDHLATVCQVRDDTIKAFAPAVRQLLASVSSEPVGIQPVAIESPVAGSPAPDPAMPDLVAAVSAASIMEQWATGAPENRPPPPSGTAVSVPVAAAPVWLPRGQDAQERAGGLALVFRDRSRQGEHWLAALRGAAVAGVDPAFLLDEFDRIRDFPSEVEARIACDAALAEQPGD